MWRFNTFLWFVLLIPFLFSCENHLDKVEKFKAPKSLEGKEYDVIKTIPELSTFRAFIDHARLGEFINSSGLYTIMAPVNSAFDEYFLKHPVFNSIDDMDSTTIKRLVEYHIIKMPYSKYQLTSLNTEGWVDEEDDDPVYSGYKRETLYRPGNRIIKVNVSDGMAKIDSEGNQERIVYAGTNKFAPLFFSEFLNYAKLAASDYEYYFDRSFEPGEVFFANALLMEVDLDGDGITEEGYSAENGYIFLIDQVVEPMQNPYEALFEPSVTGNRYNRFGDLANEFAEFIFNNDATNNQEGANEGLEVNDLYDLNYPTLAFNLLEEATASPDQYSVAYHNAFFAPNNEAYNTFISEVLTAPGRYATLNDVPHMVKRSIVNNHMAGEMAFYKSRMDNNFFFSEYGEILKLNGINELDIQYGSSSTFIGIDKVLIPRMFHSVVSPVLLNKSYSTFLWSLYLNGLIPVLNSRSTEYTLFPISNTDFATDSTFFFSINDNPLNFPEERINGKFQYTAGIWDMSQENMIHLNHRTNLTDNDLSWRSLISGHIAIDVPTGNCKKEFLKNLNLYYIVVDNETGIITGGVPSVDGYNGSDRRDQFIGQSLEVDLKSYNPENGGFAPDNGRVYPIASWLSFTQSPFTNNSLVVDGDDRFLTLIELAGLINSNKLLTFLDEGENMTLFIPTTEALDAYETDTLSKEDLISLIQGHFVITPDPIFTDNFNRNPLKTKFKTKNGQELHILTDTPDQIKILNTDGTVYYTVNENSRTTNIMHLGWDNLNENDGNTGSDKKKNGVSIVVHQIDSVIYPGILFED